MNFLEYDKQLRTECLKHLYVCDCGRGAVIADGYKKYPVRGVLKYRQRCDNCDKVTYIDEFPYYIRSKAGKT